MSEGCQRLRVYRLVWFVWVAYNPDEPYGLYPGYTRVYGLTRKKVIDKGRKRFYTTPKPKYEEVIL